MQELNDTAHKLLDAAESYTQTHGFNAFSYKDIQNEVGIKTSSIHYYFPTKQDLAMSMTERYVENFRHTLKDLAKQHKHGIKRLEALSTTFGKTLNEGKFCMCGMLASDTLALPDGVNSKIREFFRLVEEWISDAIEIGIQQKAFKSSVNPTEAAALFLAVLEGGMLIARTQKKSIYLENVVTQALNQLKR